MADQKKFREVITNGYSFKGESFAIGMAMMDGEVSQGVVIQLPLKTMNRHGLIAGATGTGKTKTLQLLAEGLREASVPVLLMDIKGDLSGIGASGEKNNNLAERIKQLNITYSPTSYPVEMMSLSKEEGVRLRATVSEFGPLLLSKILGLNDTQEGVVAVLFKYCDDQKLPLLDLKDFIKVLQYASAEGKGSLEKEYGKISTTSTGTILRKVIELQQHYREIGQCFLVSK